MSDKQKLVYAITKFLEDEVSEGELSEESAEGLAIGIQVLQTAYNITSPEPSLQVPCSLQIIFQNYLRGNAAQKEPTLEEKSAAEILKDEGNAYMDSINFKEAIACYTKAIELDPRNAVYYCNRAAASNNIGDYDSAIQDCKEALKHDPSYHKAYARLGVAYARQNQHKESVASYKKALELQPNNENYKNNLRAEEVALANNSMNCTITVESNNSGPVSFTLPNLREAGLDALSDVINLAGRFLSDNPPM